MFYGLSKLILEIVRAQASGKIKANFNEICTEIIMENKKINNATEKAKKIKKYVVENYLIDSCAIVHEMPEDVITITIYHKNNKV